MPLKMATEYKTLQPKEFYQTFLDKKSRPDGRDLLEFRPTTLTVGSIGTADGSSIVKCGNTTVVCGIKAEVAPPLSEEPTRGFIVPNVTLPPLCSSQIKSGPPGETAQAATQFVAELVKNNLIIDLEKLCVKESKWAWVLYVDLLCLNLDGALLDTCIIALVAAMKDLTLPTLSYDEELDKLSCDSSKRSNLDCIHELVSSTFSIFDKGIIVSDPTNEEEQLAAGSLTITMDKDVLAHIYKPGGHTLSEKRIETLIKKSELRAKETLRLIHEACTSPISIEPII